MLQVNIVYDREVKIVRFFTNRFAYKRFFLSLITHILVLTAQVLIFIRHRVSTSGRVNNVCGIQPVGRYLYTPSSFASVRFYENSLYVIY